MIHVHYYETTTPPVPPVVFLAGPTTDSRPGPWRGEFEGQPLSAWRADLAHELYGLVLRYHARQAVYRALTGDDRDEPRGLLQLCHRLLRTMPWGPRYLVLGLPASAQKVSRFREAAAEAALPVHTTLVDVARAVAR